MTGRTGATIVEENGDMKVKSDTSIVTTHLRLLLQFKGFAGSFGPSHVICRLSQYRCWRTVGTMYDDFLILFLPWIFLHASIIDVVPGGVDQKRTVGIETEFCAYMASILLLAC
jgi:hypothetical protein